MNEQDAVGLCMCMAALTTLNGQNQGLVNQSMQKQIDYQYMIQSQMFQSQQSQIDALRYQMLQMQLQTQLVNAIPQMTYAKENKRLGILELDRILFQENPIRDWCENRLKEIDEKYKWIESI